MAIRLMLAVILFGTATAHAQISGAGGALPAATAKANQHPPVGATRHEPPAAVKAPAKARPVARAADAPSQPVPAKQPARAAVKGR